MNRNRIFEMVWLVIFIVSIGLAVYVTITKEFSESYRWYFMVLVSAIFYYIRRMRRIKESQA